MECQFCTREAVVRGLCRAHYMRQRRYGDAQTYPRVGRPRTEWRMPPSVGGGVTGGQLLAVNRRMAELALGRGLVKARFKYRTPEGYLDYDALEAALERARQVARDWFIATYLDDGDAVV